MIAVDMLDLLERAEKRLAEAVCAAAKSGQPTTALARYLDSVRDERRFLRYNFGEISEEEFDHRLKTCVNYLKDAFDETDRFPWVSPELASAISSTHWLAVELERGMQE